MKKTNLRIKKEILKVITILSVFMFFLIYSSNTIFAEIIFEDNFDSQNDWLPTGETECVQGDCSATVPTGWSYYRSMDHFTSPTYERTLRINEDNHRGPSGKALTIWNESYIPWSADGQLTWVDPNNNHDELYVQYWMKMQTPFLYADPEIETVQVKYFRIGHYTRSGNIYDYSDGSSVSPHFIWDTKLSTWGWFSLHSYRSGPNYEYILNPNDPEAYWPTAVNTFGDITDGQWHKMVFYVKMNTQNLDGSWNSDGINRFWFDDSLILEETSIPWMESGVARPWNYVAFGGNQDNVFTDTTSGDEQWYAIDDVVISTEPIPNDYIIGGGTSTITRADVDNNATINTTDAMLTLRNSLGLNMSSTNWFSSATTGDVNCDNVSNSTDAMLILRHSLGLDMSGTGWCE